MSRIRLTKRNRSRATGGKIEDRPQRKKIGISIKKGFEGVDGIFL